MESKGLEEITRGVYELFRRLLSVLLVGILLIGAATPALGESGITAGEALFGNGTGAAMNDSTAGTPSPEATAQAVEGEDVYGADDQASITDYPTLQLGDRDEADSAAYIVMLQNRLIALGFLNDVADGVYGENTETAVAQFQKLNGLERTGIADPETQRLLFSDMSALTTPSPEDPVVYGGDAVRVQTKLVEWGFMVGSVDGVLGKASTTAIADFKNYLIDNDMVVLSTPEPTATPAPTETPAPDDMPVVIDELLPTAVPEPTSYTADGQVDDLVLSYVDGEIEFPIYRQTVQNGDKNSDVKRVQTRLKQLKYLYSADGEFGLNTARALMYFQRKCGLQESGIADEATQRALFSSSAPAAEEYVFPYKIIVDISEQKVGVFQWDGEAYSVPYKLMTCSTGKDATPTPLGTYQSYGRLTGEWYYFKEFNCYAKWAYGIVGGILFHSVTYSANKVRNENSVHNLGRKASHGCIRLIEDDVKWIYDNCPYGTTVVIQE